MEVDLFDQLPLTGARMTSDGFLVASACVARSGIQLYTGAEVDKNNVLGLRDRAVVRVYRPEDEVFSDAAMKSYAYRTITNDHPQGELVDAKNFRQHVVGFTGGEVVRDGTTVRVPMLMMDAGVIADYQSGKKQASMGYRCVLDATPGVTPDGEEYDAVQRDTRMNHVAVVRLARAGEVATIGDGQEEPTAGMKKETTNMTTKITFDGMTIETTDQGAQAIAKLQSQMSDAASRHTAELTARDTQIASLNGELAKRDAKIDELQSKVMDGAALDAAVAVRSDLIARAQRIIPTFKADGMSNSDIRRSVVVARVGDSMKDKPVEYIEARFDMLADAATATVTAQDALRAGLTQTVNLGDDESRYQAAVQKQYESLNAHRKG